MKPVWMMSKIEREIAKRRKEISDIHEAMWHAVDDQMYRLLEKRCDELHREIYELEKQAGLR